jgi:hypothetical protein
MYIFLMLKVLPQKASDEFGWDVVIASSKGRSGLPQATTPDTENTDWREIESFLTNVCL